MKKNIIVWLISFVFVVGLLLITSCSKQAVKQVPQDTDSQQTADDVYTVRQSISPQPPKPTCDDSIMNQGEANIDCGGPCKPCSQVQTFSEEHIQSLKAKQIPPRKLTTLWTMNADPIKPGETVMFPVAVYNEIVRPMTFKLGVKFIHGKDLQNSLLQTTNELFDRWADQKQLAKTYSLPERKGNYTYVSFTVGNVLDERGSPVVPGKYNFYIVAYYYDQPVWQEYTKQEIVIYVK